MNFLTGLIVGLVFGWALKDRIADRVSEEVQRRLEPQTTGDPPIEFKAPPKSSLPATPLPVSVPVSKPAPSVDNLQQIKGIGPTFAKRFTEAGITSFAALAALTPDQVREITNVQTWQKIGPEQWISEAKRLADNQ